MELAEFRARHSVDIRAQLDWSLLERVSATAETIGVRRDESRRRLALLSTVWYQRTDGRCTEWWDRAGAPIKVQDADPLDPAWPETRRSSVLALTEAFKSETTTLALRLPVYRIGGGFRFLLLDGNHRAVAAYRAGRDVRLLLDVLRGPVDPVVLPDLRHYEGVD